MKKKNSKEKVKNKKIFIIIISIIITAIIIGIIIYSINVYNKKVISDIKNHYNKYISTTKKTTLYNKSKEEVGTIEKNFNLELEKQTKEKNKYFKIKDSNYYIFYKDVKKIKSLEKDKLNTHYLTFNKNIKTSKKIALYKNNKKVLELNNGINLPIEFIKNNEYKVYYLNNILQVKKDKNVKEIEKNNNKEEEANYISIIHYENINDTCSDYNCITTNNVKEQITKLKEAGYYEISLNEYKEYLNGNIHLKNKALLLTTSNKSDNISNLNNELNTIIEPLNEEKDLIFTSTNKKSTKEDERKNINRYQIKSYSTIENILKMASGEEVIEKEPVKVTTTTATNTSGQGIAVLNYHFFYDPTLGESCNEGICLTTQKFREHLDYLKNNNFKTLTIGEFTKWMYNEIELPEKSVLITVDDGAMGTGKHNGNKLIPLLEEYQMHATLFLIAGWWDIGNYISPYLDIQSHTFDMHQYGNCGRGQINCATKEEAKKDLSRSLEIIGRKESFCFPFYYSSDTSIEAVKEVGFKLAFVGGNRKATKSSNKYLVPRYPIHSNISLERFISIVN